MEHVLILNRWKTPLPGSGDPLRANFHPLKLYVRLTILLALFLLPILSVTATPPSLNGASLAQNPTVRIDPAQSVVGPGETFTVAVMIDQASSLGGFEFTLWFTPATVTVDDVTLGDFLGSTGRTVIPVTPIIDNQTGRASFGAASVGSAPGPDGTGTLATITFTAQDAGQSFLDLENVIVLDTHAQHQTATVQDGTVQVASSLYRVYLPLVLKVW